MNFMNRKMFAVGGQPVSLGAYDILDKATGQITKVNPGFLENIKLKAQYAYPLLNGFKSGQIDLGQGVLQELESFRKTDEPFGVSGNLSSNTRIDDLGTAAFDLSRGGLRAVEGPLRGIAGFFGEITGTDALKDISSFDFRNMKKKDFNSVIPSREENRSMLLQELSDRGLGKTNTISDFTKDIEAIEQPVVEAVETKDVLDQQYSPEDQEFLRQNPDISPEEVMIRPMTSINFSPSTNQPTVIEELPTLSPVTGGETLGVLNPFDTKRRQLDFEKAMIGRDEFGNLLPEGRLLQDPTIAKALEELTPIESLVDVNKTEADSLLETQDKFNGKFGIPKIELDKVDTTVTEEEFNTAKAPVVPKETTGLFGSDRFLDFIRNVGGELARTGQMGEGLALGAAKAGEERAARDLMEEQEKKKYERDLELAVAVEKAKSAGDNIPDIMKPDKILELNNNVKRDITDFQGGLAGVGFVDYAIEIIEDAEANDKPVGGLGGFIASLVDKGYAFVGMGKDFDSLSADSKVAELTKVVKQKNLQAILGESGRTISDKDRIIIEKVFGDLSAFESVSSVLGKLKESRRGLAESNAERYSNIQTNSDFLLAQGSYGQRFYTDMLPSLKSILGIDPYASQSASARATFGGQPIGAGSQSITDIDL